MVALIITGEPNEFVREIHTRMPVILPEEHHQAWRAGPQFPVFRQQSRKA
jgi:putative SOS response-associated peptidase YedK